MKIRGQAVYEPQERILRMSMPEPNSGCWLWLGALRNGYGRMIVGSRANGTRQSASAHRYSYEAFGGNPPRDKYVLHRCDNRMCVNPSHLFLGTHQDNVDDRERKGRNNIRRDEAGRFTTLPEPPK